MTNSSSSDRRADTTAAQYGPQYGGDDAFKAAARLHQSRYRVEQLGIDAYRDYGNRLATEAALAGKNFYPWPGMMEVATKRFGKGDKPLYSDMLRSEHVPFNFFVPLRDVTFTRGLIAGWTRDDVQTISSIELEWAPKPAREYLDDNTSFDAYVTYATRDGQRGAVGIEVKYTEGEYGWGKRERLRMFDESSPYHRVHRSAGIYANDALPTLATKRFKQLWRNQLLGEAMLQHRSKPVARFTSVVLYPSANEHFATATPEYTQLLKPDARNSFVAVTYESFIETCRALNSGAAAAQWLDYLEARYIRRDVVR